VVVVVVGSGSGSGGCGGSGCGGCGGSGGSGGVVVLVLVVVFSIIVFIKLFSGVLLEGCSHMVALLVAFNHQHPSTTANTQNLTLTGHKKRKVFNIDNIMEVMGIEVDYRRAETEKKLKTQEAQQKQQEQQQHLQQLSRTTKQIDVDGLSLEAVKDQIRLWQKEGMKATPAGCRLVFSEYGKQKNKAELVSLLKEIIASENV
jgi:hypothetical protein